MTARSVHLRLLGRVCQHERYSRLCQRRAALDALSGQRLLALLRSSTHPLHRVAFPSPGWFMQPAIGISRAKS